MSGRKKKLMENSDKLPRETAKDETVKDKNMDSHLLDKEFTLSDANVPPSISRISNLAHSIDFLPASVKAAIQESNGKLQKGRSESNLLFHVPSPTLATDKDTATVSKNVVMPLRLEEREGAHLVDEVLGRPLSQDEVVSQARRRRNSYNQYIDMNLQAWKSAGSYSNKHLQ